MIETSVLSDDKVYGHALFEQADIDQTLPRGPLTGTIRFYAIGTVAAPIVLFLLLLAVGRQFDLTGYARTIGSGVLLVGLLLALRKLAARRHLEGKTARELDTTYELDASGYAISTGSSTARTAWQAVHHVKEVPSAFLIFVTPHVHMVWPKRAFAEADVPRVRALLAAHVVPKGSKDRTRLYTWLLFVAMVGGLVVYSLLFAPQR